MLQLPALVPKHVTRDCDKKDEEYTLLMLKDAKQDINDVLPVTQKLYCTPKEGYFDSKYVKILDIDEHLIQRLESGERLSFKGSGKEKLVFCTEDETFEVKEGEISNSLVLCPELLFVEDINKRNTEERIIKKQSICGIYHNYLELRLTFPRLGKLRTLLEQTEYAGPENEVNVTNKGYYLVELMENIQCSREELINGLENISACCIDGRWRLISQQYESSVLSLIIGFLEEQNTNIIRMTETKKVLESQVPEFIIDYILFHFATCLEEDNDAFVLREDRVCRCFAEALLTAAGGTFLLSEFMKTWKASLPTDMEANLQHLEGLVLMERNLDEEVICLFPEYSLPENIPERFRLLFKRKEKWTFTEIKPYIEKLATKAMNVNSMLTKYSRSSTANGERVYGARHAN